MDLHKQDKCFNNRFGIENSKENFQKFKQRIKNVFSSDNIDDVITREGQKIFCQYYAISDNSFQASPNYWISSNIKDKMQQMLILDDNDKNNIEFLRFIEVVLNLPYIPRPRLSNFDCDPGYREKFFHEVCDAIQLSKLPLSSLVENSGKIIIYPQGEEVLDNEIVNKVLKDLDSETNKHVMEAIEFLRDKRFVKSAESLRRALEEFLRYKLSNTKGLEGNINTLVSNLKESGQRQPEIRTIILQVFKCVDKYFNEHSKHKNGELKLDEAHFLLYQALLLMKYINDKI